MSKIVDELKAIIAKIEGNSEVQTAETEAEALGSSAWKYIKTNGLQDLVAIAKSALLGAATGTSYTAILATVVSEGEAAGISIAKGAEAIVVAGAQADLIAAGQLVSPSTTALVVTAPAV